MLKLMRYLKPYIGLLILAIILLFVHYFDPHQSYMPPAPFDTRYPGRDDTVIYSYPSASAATYKEKELELLTDVIKRKHELSLKEKTNGIPPRQWGWGRALLMAAQVHDGRDFSECSPEEALARVNGAVEVVAVQGLGRLRIYRAHHD